MTRDLPLARLCRDHGYDVVMAVRDLGVAAASLAGEGFTLVQAPRLQPSSRRDTPPINFADMLLHEGYDDGQNLRGAMNGWEGLLKPVSPACVVYNHSPTALLAARLNRIPVLISGTGFEIPPQAPVLPQFRPWEPASVAQSMRVEQALLAQINRATGSDCEPLQRLTELYPAEAVKLVTFAEPDSFGPR